MKLKSQFKKILLPSNALILFSSALIAMILYTYLSTEVRLRLENLLYDMRIRLLPQYKQSQEVSVVTISDKTISTLNPNKEKQLSTLALVQIINAAIASDAKAIGVLMPHQDFDYDSEDMWPLVKIAKSHANVYFGIFDENRKGILEHKSSLLVEYATESVFAADTNREYRRAVVREEILQSKLGGENRLHLIPKMALDQLNLVQKAHLLNLIENSQKEFNEKVAKTDITVTQQVTPAHFRIKYKSPQLFPTVTAENLVSKGSDSKLKGKLVLIGYTAFRKRFGAFLDGTYVNTPWQSENNFITAQSSTPLLYVHASALENLLTDSWFRKTPLWLNFLQIIFIGFLSFRIWHTSKTIAVTKFISIYIFLLLVHVALMIYTNTVLPLGDTIIVSLIAATAGAFVRGQHESAVRAKAEAKAQANKEIGKVQERFLHKFSNDLYKMNKNALSSIESIANSDMQNSTILQARERALSSCLELEEYLKGIKQLSSLEKIDMAKTPRQKVRIVDLLNRLSQQFEAKLLERDQKLITEGNMEILVWSDQWFLESILFNLISNAIKYSPENSTIIVTSEIVNNKKVKISVKDSGPGIDQNLQERIFEKFYRVKDDHVYKVKGTGLGLYLSRYFAKKIGTDIMVESVVGTGSIFSVPLNLVIEKKLRRKQG
ncbi:MAG: ATP-binding protein [Bdellovibrionota bacterium]